MKSWKKKNQNILNNYKGFLNRLNKEYALENQVKTQRKNIFVIDSKKYKEQKTLSINMLNNSTDISERDLKYKSINIPQSININLNKNKTKTEKYVQTDFKEFNEKKIEKKEYNNSLNNVLRFKERAKKMEKLYNLSCEYEPKIFHQIIHDNNSNNIFENIEDQSINLEVQVKAILLTLVLLE